MAGLISSAQMAALHLAEKDLTDNGPVIDPHNIIAAAGAKEVNFISEFVFGEPEILNNVAYGDKLNQIAWAVECN